MAVMSTPIQPLAQRHDWDCGPACLAAVHISHSGHTATEDMHIDMLIQQVYDAVLATGCHDAVWSIDLAYAALALQYHVQLFTSQPGFNLDYAAHPFYESQIGG